MLDWRDGSDFWVSASGDLYIAEGRNNRVRKVDRLGRITTVAGNGIRGFSGDGGQATFASLNNPAAVVVDSQGNIYIGDCGNFRIRKIDTTGTITTVAGTGKSGHGGDGEPATSADLAGWLCLQLDPEGNLYIAQVTHLYDATADSRIRKIDCNGTITAFAGTGEPGMATEAPLSRRPWNA